MAHWTASQAEGDVERTQEALEELPRVIVDFKTKLAALDAVFPLHDLKVDPTAVKCRRQKSPAVMPYGVITKAILRCLKEVAARKLT